MSTDIQNLLKNEYQLGTIHAITRFKNGVSNENYYVVTSTGQYVARVCHFEPQNQINVMLPFLEHAEIINYQAPRLIKTGTGAAFVGPDTEPVLVMTAEQGQPGNYETINTNKLASLGSSLANLHRINWNPEQPSITANTTYVLNAYSNLVVNLAVTNVTSEILQVLREDFEYFVNPNMQITLTSLPYGLIHNDIIPGNVLFQNDSVVTFIDFEEVSQGIMLLDIARVLNSWCIVDNQLVESRFRAFLTSYNRSRKLTDDELRAMPIVMRFIAFRNSVYGLRMYAQKRIQNVSYDNEYENLLFIRKNQQEITDVIHTSLIPE